MGDEININVESKCSNCAFGHFEEDQEPCLKCFESEIHFSLWEIDPNYDVNRKNKTSLQDKGNEALLLQLTVITGVNPKYLKYKEVNGL